MKLPNPCQKLLFEQTTSKFLRFVVQKHHATRLHYDFRLEHAGVLKSWAVPRGPCLDPARNRLAVLVKDHAIGYGGFEGTIPPGRYGAGPVMLWDIGIWRPNQDVRQALRAGRLTFELLGRKLKGIWSLIRKLSGPNARQKEWFLRKEHDAEARLHSEMDVLTEYPLSVVTGRNMDEIANDPPFFPGKSTGRSN